MKAVALRIACERIGGGFRLLGGKEQIGRDDEFLRVNVAGAGWARVQPMVLGSLVEKEPYGPAAVFRRRFGAQVDPTALEASGYRQLCAHDIVQEGDEFAYPNIDVWLPVTGPHATLTAGLTVRQLVEAASVDASMSPPAINVVFRRPLVGKIPMRHVFGGPISPESSASMSQQARRDALVAPYRAPNPDRRLSDGSVVGSDPAPPWVPSVVDTLLQIGVADPSVHRALEWCAAGEPVARAERLLAVADAWPGRNAGLVVEMFLDAAVETGAGAAKGRKRIRHWHARVIPLSWDSDTESIGLQVSKRFAEVRNDLSDRSGKIAVDDLRTYVRKLIEENGLDTHAQAGDR